VSDRDPILIAFEVSKFQLSGQKEDLRTLRNQASFGAAISGLIATVFASLVEPSQLQSDAVFVSILGISLEFWFVVLAFSASVGFAIRVGSGWKDCTFELNPRWILRENEIGKEPQQILAKLAKDADDYFNENEDVISDARSNLWASMVFGWVQIPAWLLVLF
jgi:hypothetical protein